MDIYSCSIIDRHIKRLLVTEERVRLSLFIGTAKTNASNRARLTLISGSVLACTINKKYLLLNNTLTLIWQSKLYRLVMY